MDLHHLGVDPGGVPAAAVIVTASLAQHVSARILGADPVRRREFTTGRLLAVPEVVLCAGPLGAPSTVIAMEELCRAGTRAVVLVTGCRCRRCGDGRSGHDVITPRGAVRDEGTTASYAPAGFPAVPEHRLRLRLSHRLGVGVGSEVVRTVDVPPAWEPQWSNCAAPDEPGTPVDLESAAVFVVGSATGVATASVVVGANSVRATANGLPGLLECAASAALSQVTKQR